MDEFAYHEIGRAINAFGFIMTYSCKGRRASRFDILFLDIYLHLENFYLWSLHDPLSLLYIVA